MLAQREYSHHWKVFKNAHATLCSVFQNLRLGSMNLERPCCTIERKPAVASQELRNFAPATWLMNWNQPSATHPHFWQTCLFTIFPIISTTNRGSQFYGPQTKILDGWTKRCVCVFEWVFKSVLAQNEYSHPWKVFKKAHATLCSVFQNLRLGSINFGKIVKRQVCQKWG